MPTVHLLAVGEPLLPPSTMTANGAACPATAPASSPFNAPLVWDGTCSAMDPGLLRDSVTVDPPLLYEQVVAPPRPQAVEFSGGKTIALRCNGVTPGATTTSPERARAPTICARTRTLPGFSVCTSARAATLPCPDWLADEAPALRNGRGSVAAPAALPWASRAPPRVTVYADGACSSPLGSVMATSDQPAACFDVAPGSALGSKSATVSYQPGTCTPTLMKPQPSTVCCLP